MPGSQNSVCPICHQQHDEWPAIGHASPTHYTDLTPEEQQAIAELSGDFCIIRYPDQTDYFIRVVLRIPVNDHCEDLDYGVWVSLSEQSYNDYKSNYKNENHKAAYFGWLSNWLYGYDDTCSIPTTVQTQAGNSRPFIFPHRNFEHQLVTDFYNGITKAEAEQRISTNFT